MSATMTVDRESVRLRQLLFLVESLYSHRDHGNKSWWMDTVMRAKAGNSLVGQSPQSRPWQVEPCLFLS
jgi:hypothetical protein